MPLYEYKCLSCGDVFEVIEKFSDEPLAVHDGCGGRVERLLSPPALQFKGTGWYVTDYARSSNGKKPPAQEGKEAKTETGASATSDTKSSSTTTSSSDKKG